MAQNQGQVSPEQAIIPFTGYYALGVAPGAFVMVDTHSVWTAAPGGAPTTDYFAVITLCPDGQTSNKYPLSAHTSFDGQHLIIYDPAGGTVADLTFSGQPGTCALQGTIGGTAVSGTTPFAPVELSTWTGTYYRQGPAQTQGGILHYPYAPGLEIGADGTVSYADPSGNLQAVPSYWYDYGMFVVGLMLSPQAPSILYEMGTSSGWGRVAGNAEHGTMLVSVQLQEPAPNL